MAGYDGSIRINTELNTGGFERSSKGLISGMKRLGNSLNGIIGSLGFAFGIAGLVALGKQAIDTASDIQEVQNVVDTAFGSMSYKMEEFAKTSVKQFGLSQLSAKEIGSTFMAMASNMVGSAETASNMAINLTKRAADMASFYNRSAEDTATALHGVFTGETEVLKQYGIVQTEVNLQEYAAAHGINKKISAMSQAEKVQLRYNYVMEQTSLAAGDFARTSDSWANQTRILSEQFKELLSVLGSGLITVLTPVVKFLNTVLSALIAIAKQIGAILSKLFGISIPVGDSGQFASDLSAAAGGADDLAKGMDAAGKSAEKAGKAASKALAPFDKLNVLNQDSGGGGGSGSGAGGVGGAGGFEMPELSFKEDMEGADALGGALDGIIKKLKELKDLFVEGFFDGLGESWKDRIADIEESARNIIKTLREIFADPSVVSAAQGMIENIAYALGQVVGSIVSIGITIAQNIVGGIDKYLEQNKEFLKEKLISIFDIGGDIALLIGEAFESIAYIFEAFGSESGQQLTANIIGIFNNTIISLLEIGLKFGRDILNCIITPISDNKEELRTAFEGALGVLSEVTGTILDGINETFAKLDKVYDEHFKPFFDSIVDGLSDTLGKFLEFWNAHVQPMLDSMVEKFNEIMEEHIQPMVDKAIELIGSVADYFKLLWEHVIQPFIAWIIENILPVILPILGNLYNGFMDFVGFIADAISGLIEVIKGIIDFIVGVFTGDWEKAWSGIYNVVAGIMNVISSVIKASLTIIKTVVNNALNVVKAAFTAVFTGIKDFVKFAMENIKTVISTVLGNIKNGIHMVLSNIKSTWSNIWASMKETVVEIFNGIWSSIKGTINSILGGIEMMANGVVDGINMVIRALNNLSFTTPDWIPGGLGGKSFGFSISELSKISIPRLADGAVIRGGDPFMAVLGDQRHGQTNIETPLPTMVQAFKQAMAESGGMGGGEYTFIAQIDGRTIFEETVKQNNIDINKMGRSRLVY